MGNAAALCVPARISANNVTRILSSDGRLLIYTREQLKAAEIMIENPGMFLCESTHLRIGQRIQGIYTEEELERGQVYILLPMEMLYSVLTHDEMKCLRHRASKGMKAAAISFSKIFPEFCLFPNNNHNHNNSSSSKFEEDSENIYSDYDEQKRYSRQRSWQPSLETIVETQAHNYQ